MTMRVCTHYTVRLKNCSGLVFAGFNKYIHDGVRGRLRVSVPLCLLRGRWLSPPQPISHAPVGLSPGQAAPSGPPGPAAVERLGRRQLVYKFSAIYFLVVSYIYMCVPLCVRRGLPCRVSPSSSGRSRRRSFRLRVFVGRRRRRRRRRSRSPFRCGGRSGRRRRQLVRRSRPPVRPSFGVSRPSGSRCLQGCDRRASAFADPIPACHVGRRFGAIRPKIRI